MEAVWNPAHNAKEVAEKSRDGWRTGDAARVEWVEWLWLQLLRDEALGE